MLFLPPLFSSREWENSVTNNDISALRNKIDLFIRRSLFSSSAVDGILRYYYYYYWILGEHWVGLGEKGGGRRTVGGTEQPIHHPDAKAAASEKQRERKSVCFLILSLSLSFSSCSVFSSVCVYVYVIVVCANLPLAIRQFLLPNVTLVCARD